MKKSLLLGLIILIYANPSNCLTGYTVSCINQADSSADFYIHTSLADCCFGECKAEGKCKITVPNDGKTYPYHLKDRHKLCAFACITCVAASINGQTVTLNLQKQQAAQAGSLITAAATPGGAIIFAGPEAAPVAGGAVLAGAVAGAAIAGGIAATTQCHDMTVTLSGYSGNYTLTYNKS